jgi:ketosteroid isomerase-like protein
MNKNQITKAVLLLLPFSFLILGNLSCATSEYADSNSKSHERNDMSANNETLQKKNLAVAQEWMSTLFEPSWWELMHKDIVLEFPYGPSIGAPDRIVGREAAVKYCESLKARAGMLKFNPLNITPTSDPSVFFSEYESNRVTPDGATYRQIYINKLVVKDGKVILMREFWDPKKILDAAKATAKK